MNQYTPLFPASDTESKLDERSSTSGSDDGSSYFNFPDTQKMDEEILDDDTSSLTSQTLNADGTPKRPMNAFMIFARRRRPQVSAENQSMRTGEISKILSKEWNTMPPAEKQFFLDQAKQLKDTFNSKYPDYIYRRRPNNSRKRRRGDSGNSRLEQSPSDMGDDHDLMPMNDLSESPIDREGSSSAFSDSHPEMGMGGFGGGRGSHHHLHSHHPYHHLPHHMSHQHSYGSADHHLNHSRTQSYPPLTQDLFYQRSHETRMPYLGSNTSGSDRLSHLTASSASSTTAVSPHSHSTNYTYSSSPFALSSSSSTSSPPLLSSDLTLNGSSSSSGSASTVTASTSASGAGSSSSSWARWLPSSLATHDLPIGSTTSAGSSPVSSWASSSTDSSSTNSGGSGSSSTSSSAFPTLSSPFFPSANGSNNVSNANGGLTQRRSYDLGVPSYTSSPSSSAYGVSNGGNTRSGSPLYSNLGGSTRHSFSGTSASMAAPRSIGIGGIPPISSFSTSGASTAGSYGGLPPLSQLGGGGGGNPFLSQPNFTSAGGYGSASTTSGGSSAGGSPQMGLGLGLGVGVGVSGFWQGRGDKIEGC